MSSEIEITTIGASVVIKIRKGCACSVRSVVLSQAEYKELLAKLVEFDKANKKP